MKYGVQLYSLRKLIQEKGFEEAIKTVSLAGYQGVELAGFYMSPEDTKKLLDKYGLVAVSAHLHEEQVEECIEYIKTLGMKIVYTPGIFGNRWDEDVYPETVLKHKKALDFLNKNGVEFGYHNHDHEYKDGKDLVNKITTDVKGMKIELDVCWATYGGRNIVETMKEYQDRLTCIHIKELPEGDPNLSSPIVGTGLVDMKGVFAEAKRQGIEWGILEVESFEVPVMEYLTKSLENIKKLEKGESL